MFSPELDRRFDYHSPEGDPWKIERHQLVRQTLKEAAMVVNGATPEGREQSLAITKLEEALLWANAAIARPQAGVKMD